MDVGELAKLGELAEKLKELEGVNFDDILRGTRTALAEKKKADLLAQQIAKGKENSVTTNQIIVFPHTTHCKIFQDGRNTKNKTWSIRIWDPKRKKETKSKSR